MTSAFFVKKPAPPVFPKIADMRLPYDATKWQEEILSALHEQHPYLPDQKTQLSMNVRNVKEGFAVGNLNIDDRLRIPVVVDKFMLKPFDLFMKDGQLHPLNKRSILSALDSRHFGEAVPAGQGEASDVFLTHARPPFDGKYTFAAWTEGKPEEVEKALSNVFGTDGVEYHMAADPVVGSILEAARKGDFSKMKSEGKVKQLETNEKSVTKSAAVKIEQYPMDDLVGGVVKMADGSGQLVRGMLFDRVYDTTLGGVHDTGLFVPEDSYGYDANRSFYGSQLLDVPALRKVAHTLPAAEPTTGEPGLFYWFEADKLACTSIVTIRDQQRSSESYFISGSSGKRHSTLQKNASLAVAVADGTTLMIPKTANWLPVEKNRVMFGRPTTNFTRDYVLVQESHGSVKIAVYKSNMRHAVEEAMTLPQAERWLGTYFEPESVDSVLGSAKAAGAVKIAAHPGMFLKKKATKVDTGAIIARVREQAKIAAQALFSIGAVDRSSLAKYSESHPELAKIDAFVAQLFKIAGAQDNGEHARSVDSVLGLNAVNEQSVQKFLDGIDGLEQAKQFCTKLLMAARLGLQVDPDSARAAAFALDNVVQDLTQLRHATMADMTGE